MEYKTYPILWNRDYEKEIQAIYKMFKDQEFRIFSLDTYTNYENIMDVIEDMVKNDVVMAIKDSNEEIVACVILEDAIMFGDIITEVKLHCAVRRPYWGKTSRLIAKDTFEYIHNTYTIKKLIAEVPQCKYGIIKLLKDIGFKHEGTLKECLLYLDKNNNPKWYDKLIYTSTRKDI